MERRARYSYFWAATLILLMGISLQASPAAAGTTGQGTRVVRKANETIQALLSSKAKPGSEEEKKLAGEAIRRVRDFLDIAELGRRALQDHLDTVSKAQLVEYQQLLRQLIENSYIDGLRHQLEYETKYLGETKKGDNIVVATEIHTKRNGRKHVISVDYVLVGSKSGLRAFDIVTDGVGLVENYRAQFNKIISSDGIDGLIERMKTRLDRK